jgi:hypothetical protein
MDSNPSSKKTFRIEETLDHVFPRGRTFIALLDPQNVYFYFEGVTDVDSFELMRPALDKVAESGKCSIFSDGEFNKMSTPANREAWTKWFQAHPGKVLATNVLFPSAILKMALEVVTTITGEQMTPFPDASSFYLKLRTQAPSIIRQSRAWPADISKRVSEASFSSRSSARR